MGGMLDVDGYRVLSVDGDQVTTSEMYFRRRAYETETGHATWTWGGDALYRPDFDDSATLGCLLTLVRDYWNIPALAPVCKEGVWMFWADVGLPDALYRLRAPTEVELLVAALEVSDG